MSFDSKNSSGHSQEDEFSSSSLGGRGHPLLAEINMTPFVDICLVLLIIFMITAPFAISGINIQLPSAKSSSLNVSEESIVISINKGGDFYLKKQLIKPNKLTEAIKQATEGRPNVTVYIRADKGVVYQKVMDAMSAAKNAGVEKIGMMNENN